MPEMHATFDSIRSFPSDFDRYFNDCFGLREHLIYLNNNFKVRCLKTSPQAKVILGKNDWLYFTGEDKSLFEYKRSPTKNELFMLQRRTEQINLWLEARKIPFLAIVAPEKHSVYPEYLPGHIRDFLPPKSLYDQISAHLRAHSSLQDVFIDLKSILLDQKKNGKFLYFKADSHWNCFGAFIAYEEIMKRVSKIHPEAAPGRLSDFEVKRIRYSGDLSALLGMKSYFKEEIAIINVADRKSYEKVIEKNYNGFSIKQPVILSKQDNKQLPRAVMARDSQAIPMIPLLSERFSQIVYINNSDDHESLYSIIENEQPDFFILEIVERMYFHFFLRRPLWIIEPYWDKYFHKLPVQVLLLENPEAISNHMEKQPALLKKRFAKGYHQHEAWITKAAKIISLPPVRADIGHPAVVRASVRGEKDAWAILLSGKRATKLTLKEGRSRVSFEIEQDLNHKSYLLIGGPSKDYIVDSIEIRSN